MDSTILQDTQSPGMTLMQCTDVLYAKARKIAVVHDKSPLNAIFIDGVDTSISHSLRDC